MNTQALRKCLVELDKEAPNLFYIKGILETVVDSQPNNGYIPNLIQSIDQSGNITRVAQPLQTELTDEERDQEEFARRYNGGPIAQLQ